MNCPECGATVGADEKFCGNCGTPLQDSTPQAGIDLEIQPQDNAEPPPDQDEAHGDVLSAWESAEQETIYSEPAQLAQDPMPQPFQDTPVPDPAGTAEEYITPSAPLSVGGIPAAEKDSKNRKIIIAIVVLVVLLLCCCAAVIVALLMFGSMEQGQSLYMVIPDLMAAL